MVEPNDHLLLKRGLYYRPDNCGYTGIKEHAGRYPASLASPETGVAAIHENLAPDFAPNCFEDLARQHLQSKIDALRVRLSDLQLAADYACSVLEKFEPGDSRAVSNEFVALAAISADFANDECRTILAKAMSASVQNGAASAVGETDLP